MGRRIRTGPSDKITVVGDVTRLLERWQAGDESALPELTPLIYAELHTLARHYMRGERANHTLQPTALVNEAYLRLTGAPSGTFRNRVHFYGAAAQVMRRILVDHARQHRAGEAQQRRGGGEPRRSGTRRRQSRARSGGG